MAFIQRKDPNTIRYWKEIVKEEETLIWLYNPLERVDKILLTVFPWLGPLCWNICLFCTNPEF